ASKGFFHDQTLFNTTAMLAPGVTHDQVEKVIVSEIEKVKKDGVTSAEVERAINKLLAGIAYHRDGSFAIAGQINEPIAVGNVPPCLTLLDKLKAVTAADVLRVAKAYLNEDQSTTGWFIPQQEAPAKSAGMIREPGRSTFAARGPHYYRDPADGANS